MTDGRVLFARYAYAPNDLGYCGPAETATLFELGVTGHTDADVTSIARAFSGAWPYAALLAEVSGIADPLDDRVMRGYWTGGPLLDTVDLRDFGMKLIDRLGARAGQYWAHLNDELLPEAAPTHGFHVFGVYPWSRLLVGDHPEQPLRVLDNCRIRWGRVIAVDGDDVVALSRRLTWDGCRLGLGDPVEERVRFAVDGRGFVPDPAVGDRLALHWDSVCERLTSEQRDYLQRWTGRQLRVTNARLARERKGRPVKFLVLWRMELSLLSREMAQAVGRMADYGEALENEHRVIARYHVVGAHGGAWIYDVESHEQFEQLLARAPVFNFARYEVHPLAEMKPRSKESG